MFGSRSALLGFTFGVFASVGACGPRAPESERAGRATTESAATYASKRAEMVKRQIEGRGVDDPRVLDALRRVPRHRFVPDDVRELAYVDGPLPIGHDQTISQPYIVAFMTAALELDGTETVLEIGTGSGYQAAVLAEIVEQVYTIEIVEPLGLAAKRLLDELGYENVSARIGDGYRGWPAAAPFDAIIVTAAPDHVPEPLIDQLAVGGRMVLPVGDRFQQLILIEKNEGGVVRRTLLDVRFVPMTGEAEER